MRRFLLVVLVVGLAGYLLTGVTQIRSEERAVVRRFGRVVARPGPGLWIGFPAGIDRVERVAVDQVRRVPIGCQPDPDNTGTSVPVGQLLSGDHNLVNVQVVIDYTVRPDQVDEFVVQASRADGLVGRTAEAALAEWVAGRGVDEVLLTSKTVLPRWLVRQTQERLEPYRLGVLVQAASVTYLLPPDEVKRDFDDVTSAQTRIRTSEHKAREEADRRRRETEAERFSIAQTTAAYVNEKLSVAQTEAQAFEKRLEQYQRLRRNNPAMLAAIWWDEMGKVFERLNKNGRIDVLDSHLGPDGLDITLFAPQGRKK
jgi:membrane protease subunit HflK